jgi:hypothetical protein
MNEQPAIRNNSTLTWKYGLSWGIASFLAHAVLLGVAAFLLGEHVSAAEAFVFSTLIAVINGFTCAMTDHLLPIARLRAGHWIALAVIAAPIGWIGLILNGGVLFQASVSFAGAYTLVGLPVGYGAFKVWAARSVGPKGRPDNIPD